MWPCSESRSGRAPRLVQKVDEMRRVVVTGSTRGIGYGLVDSFLALGCTAVVSGRHRDTVEYARTRLAAVHSSDRIGALACDVTCPEQVQALWDFALDRFGGVDVWINNAGVGHPQAEFAAHPLERINQVVSTNLIGAMYGARVALAGMLHQGHGALYNVEGLGSSGPKIKGLALYASTKAGLRYLTDALVAEMKGTPLIVGALQPGMVATDLVLGQFQGRPDEWQRAKPILSIISDRVETVTPWLARRVLENRRHGARIRWSSSARLAGRFLLAPFRKRDPFGSDAGRTSSLMADAVDPRGE